MAQFFMSGGSHGFQNYNGIHPFPRHLSCGYSWVNGKCGLFKPTHKRIIINILKYHKYFKNSLN